MTQEITTEDLERFFEENDAVAECPTCGNQAWLASPLSAQATRWSLVGATESGHIHLPAPTMPVLVLTCGKCSMLRLHALRPILMWLEENPAPPPKAAE